jgi:hypothetical protein
MNDKPPLHEPERRTAVRRKAERLRCVLDVPRETEVLYLSAGGMMVSLEFTPEIGSRHRFSLGFPDRILVLSGIVRNVEHLPGSAGEFRVGIEFQDVTSTDHAFLEAFVAERLS